MRSVKPASSREVPEACRGAVVAMFARGQKRVIRESHKRVIILDQLHDGRRVVVRHLHPLSSSVPELLPRTRRSRATSFEY